MPNYLPGMLEVPWIEGQSECPCGRDDRYYAFGLWTDYCGMSMKDLRKYNSFCGEFCESEEPEKEKIVDVITATVSGTSVTFSPQYPPASDVVLTVYYQYTDKNGNLTKSQISTVMEAGTVNAGVEILLPSLATNFSITDITVSPEEDDTYYYVIERIDKDVTKKDAFRFKFVHTLTDDSELLTEDFVSSMVEAQFYSRNYVELQFSLGEPGDPYSQYEFHTYEDMVPVEGLDEMGDDEAEENIVNNAVDIVFAVDTDISRWKILDELGLSFETPGHNFEKIGVTEYNGEDYNILRYKNPDNLSLAYDPKRAPISRAFVIKFIKNQ